MNVKWPTQLTVFFQQPYNWNLINAIRAYDEELFIHSVESAHLVEQVGQRLNLPSDEEQQIDDGSE